MHTHLHTQITVTYAYEQTITYVCTCTHRCVRLSHDGQHILSCGADAKVILWEWRDHKPLRIYSGHFISVSCCDMALHGTRIVSGDNHGMMWWV
jgi:WD40 repeat protein